MILDSSAIIAILSDEPGSDLLLAKLRLAAERKVGAPTLLETLVVASSLFTDGRDRVQQFCRAFSVEVVPFNESHLLTAHAAYAAYGKGNHPAGLNFGDCMTYAVAKLARQPILYVGDDFAQTDLG